jgi:hypothetical protein
MGAGSGGGHPVPCDPLRHTPRPPPHDPPTHHAPAPRLCYLTQREGVRVVWGGVSRGVWVGRVVGVGRGNRGTGCPPKNELDHARFTNLGGGDPRCD